MTSASMSEQVKKGWETRRARMLARREAEGIVLAEPPPKPKRETTAEKHRRLLLMGVDGTRRRAQAIAAHRDARPHFIKECRMRVSTGDIWTLCACGLRVAESTVEETAEAYDRHVRATRRNRSGPVEIVTEEVA